MSFYSTWVGARISTPEFIEILGTIKSSLATCIIIKTSPTFAMPNSDKLRVNRRTDKHRSLSPAVQFRLQQYDELGDTLLLQ